MNIEDVKLGTVVKDRESDFVGTVTGIATYLHEHPQVLVTASAIVDGRPVAFWHDPECLELYVAPEGE